MSNSGFTEYVLISRAEYDCLKKTVTKEPSGERKTNCSVFSRTDFRGDFLNEFPAKFRHVANKLLESFKNAAHSFNVSDDYSVLKTLPSPSTYSLKDILRVLLYDHVEFSKQDYTPFKEAFYKANIPATLILNTRFAEFLNKNIKKRKTAKTSTSTWISYEQLETLSKKAN